MGQLLVLVQMEVPEGKCRSQAGAQEKKRKKNTEE